MELRGLSSASGELVKFDVEDCPCLISGSTVALLGKEMSPLVKAKSIHRGIDGVFEGDVVYDRSDSRFLGNVVYSGGFYLYTPSGGLSAIPAKKRIAVKHGSEESIKKVCTLECRTPLLFMYKGHRVALSDFVTKVSNGFLILQGVEELVHPASLKPVTGFVAQNEVADICDGEFAFDGKVCMRNFRYYVIRRSGESVLLEDLTRRKEYGVQRNSD